MAYETVHPVDSLLLIAIAITGTLIRGQLKPPTPKGWLTPPLNPLWRGNYIPLRPPVAGGSLSFDEEREQKTPSMRFRKMISQKTPKTKTDKGPRMLPVVTLSNRKTYFIDDRLRQLRNVNNPHDFIDEYECKITLSDLEAVRQQSDDFTQFITISCAQCGKTLYSGPEKDAKHLIIYCTDC